MALVLVGLSVIVNFRAGVPARGRGGLPAMPPDHGGRSHDSS